MMQKELSVLGVVLSLICAELTGISPGGLIVPGFLCLYLRSPVRLALRLPWHCFQFCWEKG